MKLRISFKYTHLYPSARSLVRMSTRPLVRSSARPLVPLSSRPPVRLSTCPPFSLPLPPKPPSPMTINETEAQIISEFAMFDDWMDKYNYLIELGKSLQIISEEYRTDQYLITGVPVKGLASRFFNRRKSCVHGRQRRHHHQRHCEPADSRSFRSDT
jgi:hypothetical protein